MITAVLLLALALAHTAPAGAGAAEERVPQRNASASAAWPLYAGDRDVNDDTLVIETTHGAVRGREEYDEKTGRYVVGFYGIPFATPPLGTVDDMTSTPATWPETAPQSQDTAVPARPAGSRPGAAAPPSRATSHPSGPGAWSRPRQPAK